MVTWILAAQWRLGCLRSRPWSLQSTPVVPSLRSLTINASSWRAASRRHAVAASEWAWDRMLARRGARPAVLPFPCLAGATNPRRVGQRVDGWDVTWPPPSRARRDVNALMVEARAGPPGGRHCSVVDDPLGGAPWPRTHPLPASPRIGLLSRGVVRASRDESA
jgi:hypothetical protein